MLPVRLVSLSERIAFHEAGHCVAALTFSIPIISVSITAVPHMYRGRYSAPPDLGSECMVTLCLAGPAAERLFCGPINDRSDKVDVAMAREYWPAAMNRR
jgi:Zn-dependent protease